MSFTRMYLYLMFTGYNVNDIAAFMTSPVAEFIDSQAASNMFQAETDANSPVIAINKAMGLLYSSNYLHGTITRSVQEEEGAAPTTQRQNKQYYVKDEVVKIIRKSPNLTKNIVERLGLEKATDLNKGADLDQLMQALILEVVKDPNIMKTGTKFDLKQYFSKQKDREIQAYIRTCQDLIQQLIHVKSKYEVNGYENMIADTAEYKKIYELASELSGISSAYLGLNQGLPTDKVQQLALIQKMQNVISDREKALKIKDTDIFAKENASDKDREKAAVAFAETVDRILEHSPFTTKEEIRDILQSAHDAKMINHFDITKLMTDEDYKEIAKDYAHIIKGTLNVVHMMDTLPHYKTTFDCLRAFLLADQALVAKSRLITEKKDPTKTLTDDQFKEVVQGCENIAIYNFVSNYTINPRGAGHTDSDVILGFNSLFDLVQVDSFDLSTPEGLNGFKRFVETEFLTYLKEGKYKTDPSKADNPAVKHLRLLTTTEGTILATDIDLNNPEVTVTARLAFDEILRGMAQFENIKYNENGTLSIADILQLYNLIQNKNRWGKERLTATFQACYNPDNILQRYFKATGNLDNSLETLYYPDRDYQINTAPKTSIYNERHQTAPYIKVKDPIWGYIIKQRTPEREYKEYQILPAVMEDTNIDRKNTRLANYYLYRTFEMPSLIYQSKIKATFNYENDTQVTDEMKEQIRLILNDLSKSGKIFLVKIC